MVQKQRVNVQTKPVWTDDDEQLMRELFVRRKAAGFRKPSRDVGGQTIRLCTITPNPNTVASSIVALVALHGTIKRRDLLVDMSDTVFPHRSAQPKNPKWCQNYISGCIRNGFLEIVPEIQDSPTTVTDTDSQTPVWVAVSHLRSVQV